MEIPTDDLWTIPNVVTAGRLAFSPFVAVRTYREPVRWWWRAGLFALSDMLDGKAARLGRQHPRLAALGFRESEWGRKADPITDKIFVTEMTVAGLKNKIIPKSMAAASLCQKLVVSALTVRHEIQGIELDVTRLGKAGEMITNLAIGGLFAAESLNDEQQKQYLRQASLVAAMGGIAAATAATYGYYQAGKDHLA